MKKVVSNRCGVMKKPSYSAEYNSILFLVALGSHTGETKAWHKLRFFLFISEVAMKPLQSSLTFFLPSVSSF